tara:strand:+ start:7267 stop:7758 length:492 start_codon:yes stop_codon:yes gene_type:complete
MLDVVKDPADILHTKCDMVDFKNVDIEKLSVAMHESMSYNKGIGLAAPQVNKKIRMFVMQYNDKKFTVVNPEIVDSTGDNILLLEGCLSFPNLFMKVKRPETVFVKYYDEQEKLHEDKLQGWISRIFQHEYDHLEGVTFDKRVSRLVLDMAKKRMQKDARRAR